MGDEHSSGSNAGVVIVIALLVLALPCCGGVALLGLGVFSYRAASVPAAPMDMKMSPPMMQDEMNLEPIPETTVEPGGPDPAFKDLLPKDEAFKNLLPKDGNPSESKE